MKKLLQTRLHNPPEVLGNCFATVIACFMDKNSPEDVLQIQEKYSEDDWNIQLWQWLQDNGWNWSEMSGHSYDDTYYMVSGKSERNTTHVCIYINGRLYHDPHPSKKGLITEDSFESLTKFGKNCFKCNTVKILEDFYKHPAMSDGRLGKCKVCTVKDSKATTKIKTSTPEGLEAERKRHRDKFHRLNYKEKQEEQRRDKPWTKSSIYMNLNRKLKIEKGYEAHHWNYNDDYLADVFVLKASPHKILHTHLNLDIEKRIFFLDDGTYLNTREKHEEFINKLNIKIHNE